MDGRIFKMGDSSASKIVLVHMALILRSRHHKGNLQVYINVVLPVPTRLPVSNLIIMGVGTEKRRCETYSLRSAKILAFPLSFDEFRLSRK